MTIETRLRQIVVMLDGGNLVGYDGVPEGYELVVREYDVDIDEAAANGRTVKRDAWDVPYEEVGL